MAAKIIAKGSTPGKVVYGTAISGDYVMTGFGAGDLPTIDAGKFKASTSNIFTATPLFSGNDLVVTFYGVKSGSALSKVTIQNAKTSGLQNLGFFFEGHLETVNIQGDSKAADSAFLPGTAGDDVLKASSGSVDIYGGSDNDVLIGGTGDNGLYGGSGNDTLTGGAGSDTFRFELAADFWNGKTGKNKVVYTKTITDFSLTDDYLSLNVLAVSLKLKLNAGASTSTWKQGDIITKIDGNDTLVLGNLNADKDPEMIIRLVGVNKDVTNQIGLGTD